MSTGLFSLMLFSWLFEMLLLVFILNLYVAGTLAICDTDHEFLCHLSNKCIPKTKVCNFIKDCLDGEDEIKCGACEFDQPPERCGLYFEPDRVFGWYRMQSSVVRDLSYESRLTDHDQSKPMYHMRLGLNQSMKHSAYLHHNNRQLIYRPMVLFPQLRPTDNTNCKFSMRLRLQKQSAVFGRDNSSTVSGNPTVDLDLIQLSNPTVAEQNLDRRKHRIVHLNSQSRDAMGEWVSYDVPIGSTRSVWTLELLVELKMQSLVPYLSSFKFTDCEPLDADAPVEGTDVQDTSSQAGCLPSEFKCRWSGICIDRSLVCDFGFDCGHEDRSDEQYCDDYPGRCDFEDETKCDWMASPSSDSWLWMSAHEEDKAKYGQLSRPSVDHTIQSSAIGGHYMLVNLNQTRKESKMIGPTVHLQDGSKDCRIRFWLTGLQLAGKSPSLHVGEQNIATESLFRADPGAAGNYWKRYDLSLLNSTDYETRYLIVEIKLILEEFSGFIALDDVSFTPGCSLAFQGEPVEDVCGEDQFYCAIPTRVTNAYCAPLEYYCDFKNDCGVTSDSAISSDEFDCPHACSFQQAGTECKFIILDSAYLNDVGEASSGQQVNEAFGWQADVTGLRVEARISEFIERYDEPLGANDPGSDQRAVNLRDFRIELPQFSECHGECQFELVYEWSPIARQLIASIMLSSEHIASEILLKRLLPDETPNEQTVRFGVGAQRSAFKLIIEVSFEGDPQHLKSMTTQIEGSFRIRSYRFDHCNFIEGLVDTTHQVQFEEFVDDEGELEFPPPIDKGCEEGFFQCSSPIVCIAEDLVCDMQRDCQGGADELDCGAHLSYDFDEEHNLSGWFSDQPADSRLVKWHHISGPQLNPYWRGMLDSGPPLDHTRGDDQGGFLLLTGSDQRWPPAESADLISPRFEASNASSCRLVFYLYFWGESLNRFQVLRRSFSGEEPSGGDLAQDELLYEIGGSDEQVDAWRRVSIRMQTDGREFAIMLRALKSSGWSDLIAIDDVSLSSPCRLSSTGENLIRIGGDGNEPAQSRALVIGICVVVASSLLVVSLILISGSRQAGQQLRDRLALLVSSVVTRNENGDSERERRDEQSWYSMEVLDNDRVNLVKEA